MTKIKELELYNLPSVDTQLTLEDVQANINSSMATQNVGQMKLASGTYQSANFVTGAQGWRLLPNGDLEANDGNFRGDITGASGTFSGTITGGSLNIPDTTTANSFHVDSSGNTWWGTNLTTGHATAPAKILNTGAATFSSVTITGGSISSTPISSIPNNSSTDISILEKSHNLVFSVTDADTIAWSSGTIVLSNGRTFSISAGNTGNMSALTYIYLDPGTSSTVLQVTTTYSTAMGANKILIGVAQNHTVTASFIPYGPGQPLIDGSNIGALSIVAGNIAASTITAGKLSVSQLSAIAADLGTITAGSININSGQATISSAGAAVFRDIDIDGHYITVDPGENIQTAVTALGGNGGIVVVRAGTHTVNYDITLPSNTYLIGETRGSSIINFNGNSNAVKVLGSSAYSTGTVAVTNGSTTVTGSGTTWTGNVAVGDYILIAGLWYPITNVGGNTTLTIGLPFAEDDVTGASYIAAITANDCKISDMTITGSATDAIFVQYANRFTLENTNITASATGLDCDDSAQLQVENVSFIANNSNVEMANTHYVSWNSSGVIDAQTGNGFTLNGVTNTLITGTFVVNSAADGVNITDCRNCRIDGVFVENAGSGIEFVSGNDNFIVRDCRIEDNGADGIKLTATSDNIFIQSSFIKDNTGYGVNVVASTDDSTVVTGNNFSGNTTAAVNDTGTGTVIRGNVGVADNTTAITTTIIAGEALSANDAVYIRDTRTNATLSSSSKSANVGISGGNLIATHNGSPNNWSQVAANMNKTSGKWYFEVTITAAGGAMAVGISNSTWDWTAGNTTLGSTANSWAYVSDGNKVTNATGAAYGAAWTTGDVIGCAFDVGGGTLIFYKNGVSQGTAYSAGLPSDIYCGVQIQTTPGVMTVNFGATEFVYVVPSGYNEGLYTSTGAYEVRKTSASSTTRSNSFIGFAQAAYSAAALATISIQGVLTTFSGLTPASFYYLSNTTGLIATSAGSNTRKVGIAVNTTTLLITNIW